MAVTLGVPVFVGEGVAVVESVEVLVTVFVAKEVGEAVGVPVFVGEGVAVRDAVEVPVGEGVIEAVGVFVNVVPGPKQFKFTSEMALIIPLSVEAASLKSASPPLTVTVTVWS